MPSHVADEYTPIGYNPSGDASSTLPTERRTLWYENSFGTAALHAYNLEGSVLVEYLGKEDPDTGAKNSSARWCRCAKDCRRECRNPLGQPLLPRWRYAAGGR